jgi:thiamine-phosphate pyrophosphorylase
VYLVTDRHQTGSLDLFAAVGQALRAGVRAVQLREKDLSGKQLAEFAAEALRRVAGASAILVNDRMDVACALKAAGVHLGEHSLPVKEAIRLVSERGGRKDFLVGASIHSLETALHAEEDGADYVIFGPVYATPSKAKFGPPQGLAKLQEVCERLKIPVLAIGGITLENARETLAAGASGIAAIRLFQEEANLPALVKQLRGTV